MSKTTSPSGERRDGCVRPSAEDVRGQAAKAKGKHGRRVGSARDGRILSALMLPFFVIRPPSGYGILTTTGRKTGKTRRKCIRVIRHGNKAYLVCLRLPGQALRNPDGVAAWVWNIRSEPRVSLRIRGGTFAGIARELSEPAELVEAREVMCEGVNLFDYGECSLHLRGRPTKAKITELHGYWFDTGTPLVIELPGARQ